MAVIENASNARETGQTHEVGNRAQTIWEQMSPRVALILGFSVAVSASSVFVLLIVLRAWLGA